jgi:hypothetical protein
MKRFSCRCGEQIFFENTECLACGTTIGFDPATHNLLSLLTIDGGVLADSAGRRFRHCKNRLDFSNCNWLVTVEDRDAYCVSCRLNRTIPNLTAPANQEYWNSLEVAKRRLLFSLLELGLPIQSKARGWPFGLAFDFIEDRRGNPAVEEERVVTGHEGGIITINVTEADDVLRAMARKHMNEQYRTLLGHLRHESGHYYFDYLINDDDALNAFRSLFGDERSDYDAALEGYYGSGPAADWRDRHLSAYAAAHPHEDWAETWAHYLHITDCLQTAAAHELIRLDDEPFLVETWMDDWRRFAVVLNELNRSMGLRDAYPFVINDVVTEKLRFIHLRLAGVRRAAS